MFTSAVIDMTTITHNPTRSWDAPRICCYHSLLPSPDRPPSLLSCMLPVRLQADIAPTCEPSVRRTGADKVSGLEKGRERQMREHGFGYQCLTQHLLDRLPNGPTVAGEGSVASVAEEQRDPEGKEAKHVPREAHVLKHTEDRRRLRVDGATCSTRQLQAMSSHVRPRQAVPAHKPCQQSNTATVCSKTAQWPNAMRSTSDTGFQRALSWRCNKQ